MTRNSTLLAGLGLTFLVACNGGKDKDTTDTDDTNDSGDRAVVNGRTTDSGSRTTVARPLGSTTTIGSGDVEADGSYSVVVTANAGAVVITAYDEFGAMTGSVLVDAGPGLGSEVVAAPIDAETSVEAAVAAEVVASAAGSVDTVDLRGRINAEVASAVSTGDATASIAALAAAQLAASAAEDASLQAAGCDFDVAARLAASIDARQSYDAALDAAVATSAAQTALDTQVAATFAEAGVSAQQAAEADAVAGLAFGASVKALATGAQASDVTSATHTSGGSLSAMLALNASIAALVDGDASVALEAEADAVGTALYSAVLAGNASADASAWSTWSVALVGDGSVEGSVIEELLTVDGVTSTNTGVVVDAAVGAASFLSSSVEVDVAAAFAAGGSTDAMLAGEAAFDAYATYTQAVSDAVVALATTVPTADLSGTADVLVVATGSAAFNASAP